MQLQYFESQNFKNITFCKGFEAGEPRTSEFFKLRKIRTGRKLIF